MVIIQTVKKMLVVCLVTPPLAGTFVFFLFCLEFPDYPGSLSFFVFIPRVTWLPYFPLFIVHCCQNHCCQNVFLKNRRLPVYF